MKIAISSVAGPPDNPSTWSNAPAHLIAALEARGHTCVPIDSSCLSISEKALLGAGNALRGLPWNAVSWFGPARKRRGTHVANIARHNDCDLIICTGTLDAPVSEGVNYAIWLDNTFALLQRSAVKLPYPPSVVAQIEQLERSALNGARSVLPFSRHVRDSVIRDYGVHHDKVHAVGCGSGSLPPFTGEKDFSRGHLLFVAKHLFSSKGGDLLLKAFPIIRAQRPQTKLILIGNAEARAKAAGMEGVEAHGFVERDVLNRFFHDASMLVQPMHADPWGQVYLEAMKARTVIVSLNVAALPELTDGGNLGVLIDEASPRKLAEAVLSTYAIPQAELDQLTRKAQARVLDHYSWPAVGQRVDSALALEGNPPEAVE